MADRENLVRMLSAEGSSFRRGDVDFLLGIEYGTRYDYRSVTKDVDARLDYILESMTRYQQLDLTRYDEAVVFVRYPACYPQNEIELEAFRKSVMQCFGYSDILFGTLVEGHEEVEIRVTLLLYKR